MWIHIGALLWAVQFMVLIYNVVCKHYSVFEQINKNRQYLKGTITIPTESIPIHAIATTTTTKKVLTRKNFEEIFVKGKLYTNPNITLNDLVEQLGIDQPTLSSFIRETYNMNFRHYINTLRIQELERLLALPANAGKKPTAFIGQVGFGSIRSYQRSKSEYGKKE
jgi:AraC-like DNA-binding protein